MEDGHFLIDHRAKKEKLEISYSKLSETQLKIKDEWDQVIEMAGRRTINHKHAKKKNKCRTDDTRPSNKNDGDCRC